ncbi:MAG: hypothetical protein LW847_11670 [Burkholderiales bacterium]|jgi:uncharacterized coiled-coil protein SlyX|nr:hypothetical protein [Burkholderiales bacterium]
MSLVTDLLDRLSGVAALKEKIAQQDRVLEGMQRLLIEQARDVAELKGSLRALLALRGGGPPAVR